MIPPIGPGGKPLGLVVASVDIHQEDGRGIAWRPCRSPIAEAGPLGSVC
jgi:hypothetical protein